MISYTPPRRTSVATVISGLCFAIAAAAFLASRLGAPYGGILQLICVAGLVAGIQITSRFILTEYTYRITGAPGDDTLSSEALAAMSADELAALPALTVVKRQGKSYRTLCNISLRTAITLTERAPLAEMERKYGTISKIFNFSANMFTKNTNAAADVKVFAYLCDFNGANAAIYLECDSAFAEIFRQTIKPFTEQGEEEEN